MTNFSTGSVDWALLNEQFKLTEKKFEIIQNPEKLEQFNMIVNFIDIWFLILIIFLVTYFLKTSASKNNLEMSYWKAAIWVIWPMFVAWFWILIPITLKAHLVINLFVFFVIFFYMLYLSLKWNFKIESKQANKIATRTVWFLILFSIIFAIVKVFLYRMLIMSL